MQEEAAKDNRWGHRDATMVLLAFRHGLGAAELVDLRWEQVDLENAILHVHRVKQGTPATREQVSKSPFVFVSERGTPFSNRRFQAMVERVARAARVLGTHMQSQNLTDEQLWRAIARNTNAMTALIHQQLELAAVNTINDIIRQAKLRESNAERIGKLERNYREYTAELRRRYSLESQEPANSTISGSDAATSMLSNTSVVIAGSP